MSHRHFIALMILLSGLLVSLVAITAVTPLLNEIQDHRIRATATSHIQKLVGDLETKLDSIKAFASSLPTDCDPSDFESMVAQFAEDPAIFAIELSRPRHSNENAKLLAQAGNPELQQPANWESDVTLAVCPLNEDTCQRVGLPRARWAGTRLARKLKGHRAILGRQRNWYPGTDPRYPVFACVGDHEDATASDMLMVTLNHLFTATQLETDLTTVSVRDVTPKPYRPVLPANAPDRQLRELASAPFSQAMQKQIGGRLFRFEAKAVSGSTLRPIWIPWALFFLTNLSAGILAISLYQRESNQLRTLNGKLTKEIDRRTAMQRHLQMALDSLDDERERVADEIHESMIQDIIGAQMFVESARAIGDEPSDVQARLATISEILSQTVDMARRTVDRLKPPVFSEVGLIGALESLRDRLLAEHGFDATLLHNKFPRLPVSVERVIYRMLEEGIENAREHSGTSQVFVELEASPDGIRFEITDHGHGFDPDTLDADRVGLSSLRQRAEALGGWALVQTCEMGTVVRIVLPGEHQGIEATQPRLLSGIPKRA